MIDNIFKDVNKHLAELFIAIDEHKEYKFYPFGVALSAIQKELHNANTHTLKRFTDYIYHLNEIFVKPYSIFTFSTEFDDKAKKVIQTTQGSIGGRPTKECETYTYAEYAVKMLSKYRKNNDKIEIDKCIETLKSQSTTARDTYTSSYCSTSLKGLITYENEFKDISNTKIIADLYNKYFELATPRPSSPEQNLNSFKDEILYLHNMSSQQCADSLKNEIKQGDAECELVATKKDTRGRPKANIMTVRECLMCNESKKDNVLKLLHTLIDGKKGKEVALVIVAAMRAGVVTKIKYKQAKIEFGDIGSTSAYNTPINKSDRVFPVNEIISIVDNIKKVAGL